MNADQTHFTVFSSTSRRIHGDLQRGQGQHALPLVLVLHGFRVHRNWGFFPLLSEVLAQHGAHVLRIDFSGNGYAESQDHSVFNVDQFAANSVSQELDDVETVLDALCNRSALPKDYSWSGELYILGHSRGAGIGLLAADRHSEIQSLALWSPLSDFDRYSERQKAIWRERGYIAAPASSLGPAFRMSSSYLEDILQHKENYSLTAAISRCYIPVALIVGDNDIATPPSEAQELYEASHKDRCHLTIIEHSSHSFGCTDPCTEQTPALAKALSLTLNHFGLSKDNS